MEPMLCKSSLAHTRIVKDYKNEVNGKTIFHPKSIFEIFKDFFANLTDLINEPPTLISIFWIANVKNYYSNTNGQHELFSLQPTTTEFILKLLEEVSPLNATGIENFVIDYKKLEMYDIAMVSYSFK